MNREEAIAIIRKECLCIDRDCDIERNCGKCDLMMPSKEPILEAYKMAIKALEQEPCEDAIDRKLVCAFIAGLISDDVERKKGLEYIRSMPSVNPQPCEDAISRQAVEDALYEYSENNDANYNLIITEYIDTIPSVKQEPKTGHWIEHPEIETSTPEYLMFYECSECGDRQCFCKSDIHKKRFCSNCGCRMVESQERSE